MKAALLGAALAIGCAPSVVAVDAGGELDAGERDAAERDAAQVLRVLALTRTTGFRHASIEPALAALEAVADEHALAIERTEDAARLRDLEAVDVVVFLSTTGDVLGATEEEELERFVRGGGGWVGVHAASDTEYAWPFYGELVGAYFDRHPAVQPAEVHVEDAAHPAVAHLPDPWAHTDEWYDFRENPRGAVRVVLTVDESTYGGGTMGADHPIAWHHDVGAGRAFYTALGHPDEAWADPRVVEHVARAIVWAARR